MRREKTRKASTQRTETSVSSKKRSYFKQADFPSTTLQQAQKIASALVDNYAGKDASPPDVALAIGVSPTSSAWPQLAGSSIAYGLTERGVNANIIKLTALGRKLVAPEAEGEDIAAGREAIMHPRVLREFFERYRRAKFPSDTIANNVLKQWAFLRIGLKTALDIVKANGSYAGIIRETPTGPFVNLDSPAVPAPVATPELPDEVASESERKQGADGSAKEEKPAAPPARTAPDAKTNRVFITHGKQKAIVAQIKELLSFGHFEPVVSVERESTAIPVPEKVFEDMRSCSAGVIHVGAEGKYLDRDGNEHTKINDNVLIEIGAAMALYGKKVILLVEGSVTLPSNLQGLYKCEFDGDRLDYEATMKLLKTFSQFR